MIWVAPDRCGSPQWGRLQLIEVEPVAHLAGRGMRMKHVSAGLARPHRGGFLEERTQALQSRICLWARSYLSSLLYSAGVPLCR